MHFNWLLWWLPWYRRLVLVFGDFDKKWKCYLSRSTTCVRANEYMRCDYVHLDILSDWQHRYIPTYHTRRCKSFQCFVWGVGGIDHINIIVGLGFFFYKAFNIVSTKCSPRKLSVLKGIHYKIQRATWLMYNLFDSVWGERLGHPALHSKTSLTAIINLPMWCIGHH